jgi:integrase
MERSGVTRFRLRYCHSFVDRTGKLRRYVRPPGAKHATPLPGAPGTAEFMAVYHAALAAAATPAEIGAARTLRGSVSAAIVGYYRDVTFRALAPGTQKMRCAILEQFRARYGERQIAGLQRAHIVNLLGTKKPFAARNWLKSLRGLMQFLVATEQRPDDPTFGIKLPKARAGEIHTWSEVEIGIYEAHHPVGTRERLALALLLYTAQRRSDVVTMGRQHVQGGALIVRQRKTGKALEIPIHPALAEVLTATVSENLTFLTTAAGKPFSPAGFGNHFRRWWDAAELPKRCSAHGLRKAACRRLAEAGCTAHQIAAISGHASLSEIQRYTKAAEQSKMARAAMATITRAFPETKE